MKPAPPVSSTRMVRIYVRSSRGPGPNRALSPVCKEAFPCRPLPVVRVIHGVTFSSPDTETPLRGAAPPATGRPWRQQAPRAARLAAALAGLVAIGAYLFVALSRLGYPFALEWLEGNSLVEVPRLPAGPAAVPAPARRLRARRLPAALLFRRGRRGPGARRLLPVAAAGVPGLRARLLRPAGPPGPARDRQPRGRDRRRRRVRRDLLRHRHVVRRRPGGLAVPRAQPGRPVRRPVDARSPRRHRRGGTAGRRGPHQ